MPTAEPAALPLPSILTSLSDEEFAKLPTVSEKEILEALRQGFKDAGLDQPLRATCPGFFL